MTKKLCKNCKHLQTDGMFGIFCGVGGNNTNYDCSKYEEVTKMTLLKEIEQLKVNYNSLSHNNGLLYDECSNKINALKKENEQLKSENEYLRCTIEDYKSNEECSKEFINNLHDYNQKLKKENEQLQEKRGYFERKKCEYFNKYNKKHLENIQLKEENEQLKSEIVDYKRQVDELDGLCNKYEVTFEELEEILDKVYRGW